MSKLYSFLFFVSILFSCSTGKTPVREELNFNTNWQFIRLDDPSNNDSIDFTQGVQTGTNWETQFNIEHFFDGNTANTVTLKQTIENELARISEAPWQDVTLPHAARIEELVVKKQWEGICYYKKKFSIPTKDRNKKLFLHFEGAMQIADVWVNGKHLLRHYGGYLPFTIDITEVAKYDTLNEVLVRLDNRDDPLVPPGKPLERLDFCYYHGLYRDVKLIKTSDIYITDPVEANQVTGGGIFVTYPEVSDVLAIVRVKTNIRNDKDSNHECRLVYSLLDENFRVIAKTTSSLFELNARSDIHVTDSLIIRDPKLWSPDTPYLYNLITEVYRGKEIVDRKSSRIGIRRIDYSREEGFRINGKPLRLVGTNRHMEYPWVGNALSDEAQYRDLYKIKQAGFNTVRLGHYPQDPSVYDACDELGLMVIDPIPGWQFFNDSELFCERSYQDIRDMIRRDRNHPCIIMWETILNESWPPAWWRDKAHAVAHEEYPGNQCFTAGDMYGYFGWDVLYNDWDESHSRPNNSHKPGFIREYGDYEFGGHYSTTRITHKDGEDALLQNAWNLQWSHNKHRGQYPWTIGDANWSMFGYNRGCCDNICYSGSSSILRIPKFARYFYRSQTDAGSPLPDGQQMPFEVFIANQWTKRDSVTKVVVFGNVDEVALLVNGNEVAKQKPDNGLDTPYHPENIRHLGGNPFDGGNCRNLKHPPFTFNNVKWENGELKAIGYSKHKKVAEYLVRTPEPPAGIEIKEDISGKVPAASGSDLLFVYVHLLDDKGTICVEDSVTVSLTVNNGRLLSPSTTKCEAGIATFLVQTGDLPGIMKLDAETDNGFRNTQKIELLEVKQD